MGEGGIGQFRRLRELRVECYGASPVADVRDFKQALVIGDDVLDNDCL